jgi:ABC-type protease/lipase transport system fused ATPase/permease subunit
MIAGSILIGRAMQPIEVAVGSWKGFIGVRGALDRVRTLFTIAGAEPERVPLFRPRGALRVLGLNVAAPGSNSMIFKGRVIPN